MRAGAAALLAATLVAGFLTTGQAARAGGSCAEYEISGAEMVRRVDWAARIAEQLEALNPELALIARIGSDVGEYGLHYTHVGFVWRDHPKGRWGLVHVLRACAKRRSEIFDQGLLNFLLDDPFALDVLILEPTPELQRAIAGRLASNDARDFHGRRYSTIAYPFTTRYQNSNQWLLELLAAAQGDLAGERVDDRGQAQKILARHGYHGSVLRIPPLKRMLARFVRADMAFDDHPREAAWRGEFETITVASIRRDLALNALLSGETELRYPRPHDFERQRPRRRVEVAETEAEHP